MSLVPNLISRLRWLRRSSTVRLSLLLSVIFALGMAVSIFVAFIFGREAIERRVDETLVALAAGTTLEASGGDSQAMILRAKDNLRGLPRPFRQAVERGGGTVTFENNYLRADIWRAMVTKDADGVPVLIALPLEEAQDALTVLAGILWTTALLVIAIALALGLFTGILAQRRLERINTTLGRLAAGDLSARTGHDRERDDLDDMARQVDRTAADLERLVSQTRNLSASIAHDLRTPLARLRARLEMLPEGEARGAALEEAGRLSGIFDTIMRVARIEAAQGRDGFEPVDLGALVAEVAEIFGPVVEDVGKELSVRIDAPQTLPADRQMLIQALANLIQNALVHGGLKISLFAKGASIGVADNGPGVPPDAFTEIVKPMVRLDAARSSEGSGLGLALVRAVADRHGADLVLAPNAPQGLNVSLNFANL